MQNYLHRNKTCFKNLILKIRQAKNTSIIFSLQRPVSRNCNATYAGTDIGRQFLECTEDHLGREKMAHLVEHARQTGHEYVNLDKSEIFQVAIGTIGSRENSPKHHIISSM